MGKHQKKGGHQPRQPKKMKINKNSKRGEQSQNEQVEDVLAWGKSKQNYYQEEENQYSEASEEQQEAQEIYNNQFDNNNNLNEQQFYDLPDENDAVAINSQDNEEEGDQINDDYVNKEIIWTTEIAELFETVEDEKASFRKKVYDSYLLILIALKEFKIPFLSQHPLVGKLSSLKKALLHFESQIPALQKKLEEYETQNMEGDQENDENEEYQSDSLPEEEQQIIEQESQQAPVNPMKQKKKNKGKDIAEGLQIYEKLKRSKQDLRKGKKNQNKKIRQMNQPKQTFKTVIDNEARLANQKILKNKGLMKRRQRGDGNSRVKLRGKYEKALVRRRAKGIIGVKDNPGRFYSGEDKILYGKIASTKIN